MYTYNIITITEDEARHVNTIAIKLLPDVERENNCFKSSCCTNSAQPSISLILAICHPEMAKFRSVATSWGFQHKKTKVPKDSP